MRNAITITEKLSFKVILKYLTPIDIFSYYWDLPPNEITYAIQTGKAIYAPYKDDGNRPSLGFYENNGKLYARDFAGYFWGDCFDAAAFALRFGKESKDYGKLLERIASDFNIFTNKVTDRKHIQFAMDSVKLIKRKMEFTIVDRDWNDFDEDFWFNRFHIDKELLTEYYVFPVQAAYVNGVLAYSYDSRNPCFAYYFGEDTNGITNWKLYYPYADSSKGQNKFVQNCALIEGGLFARKAKIGILIKSYKDVIAVEMLARRNSLSLLAFAAPTEGYIINQNQYDKIMEYVDILYTLSDYDKTGIKFAAGMRRKYITIPLLFTRGRFGKTDFFAKDLTDNLERYGVDNISKLVNLFYNEGHEALLKLITQHE